MCLNLQNHVLVCFSGTKKQHLRKKLSQHFVIFVISWCQRVDYLYTKQGAWFVIAWLHVDIHCSQNWVADRCFIYFSAQVADLNNYFLALCITMHCKPMLFALCPSLCTHCRPARYIHHFRNKKKSEASPVQSLVECLLGLWFLVFCFVCSSGPTNNCQSKLTHLSPCIAGP